VLDAKGGEIKSKASKWISYHLRILKIVELELLFCQNTLIVSYCQKLVSCGENVWLWGKGSFWNFDQFLLEYLSLWLNKWIWLRDRKLSLICKNKPSGGKEWSKYAKFESNQICVLIRVVVALLLVAFLLCWHKSPKRGRLKGKCALGPVLSILVIKCQHKLFKYETVPNGGRSAKSTQRYDSRLSTLVFVC
jgi:hypothetical protein